MIKICDIKFKDNKQYYIVIQEDNFPIPVFHIIDDNRDTITCIKIYIAEYFHFSDKEIELDDEDKIILNNTMKKYWKDIDKIWRKNNVDKDGFKQYISSMDLDITHLKRPNYLQLWDGVE